MPCSDNGWSEHIRQQRNDDDTKFGNKQISDQIKELAHNVDDLIIRNNKLAKMLCSLMRLTTPVAHDYLFVQVKGLKEWWEEHKKFDESEGRF